MKGNILRFERDKLKRHAIYKNISAIHAFEILEEIAPIRTGFDPYRLPPIEYLLDCIYTIDSTHKIFQLPIEIEPKMTFPFPNGV